MFDRITISEVPTSRTFRIAFTLLKPEGWRTVHDNQWLAFAPSWRRDSGFAVLMPNKECTGDERLLGRTRGIENYLETVFTELQEVTLEENEDEMGPYDLQAFRGRLPGVFGRVILVVASVAVEDVNFFLVGFSQDERFEVLEPPFRAMVGSFRPMVTVPR